LAEATILKRSVTGIKKTHKHTQKQPQHPTRYMNAP